MSQQVKISARDLIRRSLILIGTLGKGEAVDNDDANDALLTLNEIVDKWNIENLMIPSSTYIEIPLTGKHFYTIGTGGDVDTIRPATGLNQVFYKMQSSSGELSIPIKMITEGQYNDITLKDFKSPIPQMVYYNSSYPLSNLYVYPICSNGTLVLSVPDQFLSFPNLDTEIDLPSGYIKALRYNLAVELSIEYGRAIGEDIKELAIGAKNFIKTTNGTQKKEIMRTDNALLGGGGGFNIYTGGL